MEPQLNDYKEVRALFNSMDPLSPQITEPLSDPVRSTVAAHYINEDRMVIYLGKFFQYTPEDRLAWNALSVAAMQPDYKRCIGALNARMYHNLPSTYWAEQPVYRLHGVPTARPLLEVAAP